MSKKAKKVKTMKALAVPSVLLVMYLDPLTKAEQDQRRSSKQRSRKLLANVSQGPKLTFAWSMDQKKEETFDEYVARLKVELEKQGKAATNSFEYRYVDKRLTHAFAEHWYGKDFMNSYPSDERARGRRVFHRIRQIEDGRTRGPAAPADPRPPLEVAEDAIDASLEMIEMIKDKELKKELKKIKDACEEEVRERRVVNPSQLDEWTKTLKKFQSEMKKCGQLQDADFAKSIASLEFMVEVKLLREKQAKLCKPKHEWTKRWTKRLDYINTMLPNGEREELNEKEVRETLKNVRAEMEECEKDHGTIGNHQSTSSAGTGKRMSLNQFLVIMLFVLSVHLF